MLRVRRSRRATSASLSEDAVEPQGFVRFRQSKWFLRVLFLFCAGWMAWNILPQTLHFDGEDFGRLTTLLSIEASMAACFILEDGARQVRILVRLLRNHDSMFDRLETVERQNAEQLVRIEALSRQNTDQTKLIATLVETFGVNLVELSKEVHNRHAAPP
jgi:uncharacterized membrane protein